MDVGRIERLPQDVVNRIAAGEIIQRPANALKELLENALDAGASSIKVSVKEGGVRLLQVQDNGCGIAKQDLPLACARYATSKLRAFDDLEALATYGFRGEALASISHVAHLSLVTKTSDSSCAWKAVYKDGELVPAKAGSSRAEPVPTAGNDGTTITVEDLFYNVTRRRQALKGDEYNRIVHVVQAYAIANTGRAFVCRKQAGANTPDVNVPVGATAQDRIAAAYGEPVRRELVDVKGETDDLKLGGHVSGASYAGKRSTFLFFINKRLVDCGALRRTLDAVYAAILPKGAHPFVFLALEISPRKVDVNVHPTKSEVGFEDESEVVEWVCSRVQSAIAETQKSRSFHVQTLLPSQAAPQPTPTAPPRSKAPQKMVRTDVRTQTLDAFTAGPRVARVPQSDCRLTSVTELRARMIEDRHEELASIVRSHTWVGVAADVAMIQHQTRLYSVKHAALSEALFYQLALRQFGAMARIRLSPAPSVRDLVRLALKSTASPPPEGINVEDIVVERLVSSRAMLAEYFSVDISPEGKLETLPLILPGHAPALEKLPLFLLRTGVHVDWQRERACFETFLGELAYLYASWTLNGDEPDVRSLEHIIFPAAKAYLVPNARLLKSDVVLVTNLERLYTVFERC